MIAGLREFRQRPLLDPGEVRHAVVFRALHLGDFLCSVPALRALDGRYPGAEITLIGLPWLRSIISRFRYVDRFLDFPGYWGLEGVPWDSDRTRAFINESVSYEYDLAIQMHGDGRISNGFVAQLGARNAVGYSRQGFSSRGLALELQYDEQEHEIWRCLRLVQALDADVDPVLEFPLVPQDLREVELLLAASGVDRARPFLVVHPGASSPDKRWPAERFALAADKLAHVLDAEVLITGTSYESPVAEEMAAHMKRRPAVLAGRTSIGALAALIARSSLVLTNDSGPSHLAVATGTPSVVIFGPTDPTRWAPLDRQTHGVVCAEREAPISSVSAQRVIEKSLEILGR